MASELRRFEGVDAPALACLAWRLPAARRVASTASVGGGIGVRDWMLNIQVPVGYARRDTAAHVAEVARVVGLEGRGVGMLTAAEVDRVAVAEEAQDGVWVEATVGISLPVWAAASPEVAEAEGWVRAGAAAAVGAGAGRPGTINIVAFVPVRHDDAALANLLCTVTEAKAQALADAAVQGTGTASDAVTLVCPADGPTEPFGGPRSTYGAPVARAVYAALRDGIGNRA